MLVYSFIMLSFLLPIHSFFTYSNPINLLIGYKKGLQISCNCYILNKNIQKIHNVTELQIHLNKTLALPVRWNDGEVPW